MKSINQDNAEFNAIQYLINKNVLEKDCESDQSQIELLEKFDMLCDLLGAKKYIVIVNSVLCDERKFFKKNVKYRVLKALENEVRKCN